MSMTNSPLRRPRRLHDRDRFVDFLSAAASARRDWRAPSRNIAYAPLRAGAAKLDREIDERGDLMDIRAMDDRIDGERQARLDHITGEGALALPRAFVMAEAVVGLLVCALEGELRMVEPASTSSLSASRSPRSPK